MYDKYSSLNSFAVGTGTKLPKHKGFLFSSNSPAGATFYMLNDGGSTFTMGISFASGMNILPIQAWSVQALSTGLTGFYLN